MRNWLSVIVFIVFAIGFNQSISAQSTEYAFKGDLKAFSVTGAAGNTYVWKLTHPDLSVETLSSTTNSSGTITFSSTGTYVLLVQATDVKGCLSEPITKNIIVITEVTVTASISNASETAGNKGQFKVDLGSVNSTGANVNISYAVTGTATAGLDYSTGLPLNVVIPNGSQTAVIDLNGIIDDLLVEANETVILTLTGSSQVLFPITTNPVLATATVTIADNDYTVIPTVDKLTTDDTTPLITGTATVGLFETFKVTINGITYTVGDGNLSLSGTNWSLQIPAANAMLQNTYEVVATATSLSGLTSNDNTTNELIIDTMPPDAPTVVSQLTSDTTPVITGTSILRVEEKLTVSVNGKVYAVGDGNLSLSGSNWTLQIPSGDALPDGTYSVTATATNKAGNSTSDNTTDELIIDTTAPSVRPTVTRLLTNDSTPVISGTATVGTGEKLYVVVNGITYTTGDGKLTLSGSNWTLQIPAYSPLLDDTYSVTARVTDKAGNSAFDNTKDELVVDTTPPAIPTVDNQKTNDTTPLIKGTAVLLSGELLKVRVNGMTYQLGDGNLSIKGTLWSLQIPSGSEILDGVYPVTATITDAANNVSTDATTNELTIDTKTITVTDRLATNDINVIFRNKTATGNVLINDAGFYKFSPAASKNLDPINGSLVLDAQGKYTYTPKTDFIGADNFYYTVCSGLEPADCDTMNVTVRIVSDVLAEIPPIADDDEMQTEQNTTVRGNVLANDLSVLGEKLILNLKQKEGPTSGTLVLNADGNFVYTPKAGFVGQDYFVYEVCGEISGLCDHARVTITVSQDLNEVRLFAADDVFFSYGKALQGNLLANDLYPSASTLKVNTTPFITPKDGVVTINSNGTFNYVPTSGFVGTDQFSYEICDSQISDCDYANVIIVIKETPALYADLSIKKTGPASIKPGEVVNYEVTVTNNGNAIASSVQINDYLPKAIENAKYTTSENTTPINWSGNVDVAQLDINKIFSLFISGTVALNAPDTLKNIATVLSKTWDPDVKNNISVVQTKVQRDGPIARIAGSSYFAIGSCDTKGRILDASESSGEGLLYAWSPSIYLDNAAIAKPLYKPGITTRYKLTVTDVNGKSDTTSVLVIVPPAPKAVTDRNVYVDVPNKTILLNGSKSTGAGLSFLWQSKEGIILNGETTPSAQVSGLGMYYLQVTDSLGCMNRDSVNVGLYIQAINDTVETNVNERVIINVVRNDKPVSLINPSSISIVTPPLHGIAEVAADSLILYTPEDSYIGQDEFVYAICDYFKNCDQAKVLVLINDIPFFIPEAFSPNGDNINDAFEIKGLSKYKSVEIEIFNRWGNIVYQSKNYGEGTGKDGYWDGTAKFGVRTGSGPVPSGTYYYILKLNGNENINGSIYLDR